MTGAGGIGKQKPPVKEKCTSSLNVTLALEKIAFEQPYQATKVKTVDELLNILSLRPEYFGEEGEAGPFVYNNGEYIGTLKAKA